MELDTDCMYIGLDSSNNNGSENVTTTTTSTNIPNGADFVQFSFLTVSTVLLAELICLYVYHCIGSFNITLTHTIFVDKYFVSIFYLNL